MSEIGALLQDVPPSHSEPLSVDCHPIAGTPARPFLSLKHPLNPARQRHTLPAPLDHRPRLHHPHPAQPPHLPPTPDPARQGILHPTQRRPHLPGHPLRRPARPCSGTSREDAPSAAGGHDGRRRRPAAASTDGTRTGRPLTAHVSRGVCARECRGGGYGRAWRGRRTTGPACAESAADGEFRGFRVVWRRDADGCGIVYDLERYVPVCWVKRRGGGAGAGARVTEPNAQGIVCAIRSRNNMDFPSPLRQSRAHVSYDRQSVTLSAGM